MIEELREKYPDKKFIEANIPDSCGAVCVKNIDDFMCLDNIFLYCNKNTNDIKKNNMELILVDIPLNAYFNSITPNTEYTILLSIHSMYTKQKHLMKFLYVE